jgi:hypothetical protein
MMRSSPDPDPALAVGDDLKSAADHPSSDNSPQVHPGPHPPNSADGTYTAYSTPFEMTEDDQEEARKLFSAVDVEKKRNAPTSSYNPPELYKGSVAIKLGALLNAYDGQVIDGAVQARNYITNRLLEISQCGDVKYELRAIELLGKLSDVGAFTEKSEITVTHKTSDDLRKAIQDKVERLLDMEVVDVEAKTLEEELGIDEPPATTGSAEETTQHS